MKRSRQRYRKAAGSPATGSTGERTRPRGPDLLQAIERLAGLGHTLNEIAYYLGISRATLLRWRRFNSTFDDAYERGKARAHIAVSRTLFQVATGQAVKTEVNTPALDSNGQPIIDTTTGQPLMTTRKTYWQPSVAALIFWLCNRVPEQWQNIQRVEVRREGDKLVPLVIVPSGCDYEVTPSRSECQANQPIIGELAE